MSERFPGGFITKTPPSPTKASASGVWTVEQALTNQQAGTWPYLGPTYVEDVFSTALYTGNGGTQAITNGIDLSGNGGLVWTKARSLGNPNVLVDTARGARYGLFSNTTNANVDYGSPSTGVVSFGSTGYPIGSDGSFNGSGATYASWTFRKQPKFFDVVTWTGNGASTRTISHSLGSVPGCVISKITSTTNNWYVYHRGLTSADYALLLNTTAAEQAGSGYTGATPTAPTATEFTVGGNSTNANGATYVAYLFAHNAGGFGLTGTDNVISCGSYTGTGAVGNKITLGYEPQWLLIKRTDTANSWYLFDTMRGLSLTQSLALLPNGTNSDLDYGSSFQLNADGVTQNNVNAAFNASGGTYIYIAIRRGPMKVPTSGTSVFSPIKQTGGQTQGTKLTTSFPVDMQIGFKVDGTVNRVNTRLIDCVTINTGRASRALETNSTAAESTTNFTSQGWDNTGFCIANNFESGALPIYWNFSRAPSFHDVVCYTGTGSNFTQAHNLGVPPELVIIKNRTTAGSGWSVPNQITSSGYQVGGLNTSGSFGSRTYPGAEFTAQPTASSLFFGTAGSVNSSGATFVAYLFATCAGVSKVGSYTGTGTTKQVDCGFTGGARFVLIKRTDSTGDWYVWDTARGIVAGNDPHLSLNTSVAEVTTDDTIDTDNTGFVVNQVAATNVNVNAATYIFLAIA